MFLASNLLLADDFTSKFSGEDAVWHAANDWSNGSDFNVGWRRDHAILIDGQLVLTLDNSPCSTEMALCSGKSYASGEYRTQETYGYGVYSAEIQAVSSPGVVTSFFTYTGASEGTAHHEIDIEILGQDPTKVQLNYYVDGVGGHEVLIDLGFDSSLAMHSYSFDWQEDKIIWLVDGAEVYRVASENLPTIAGKIMVNTWPVSTSLASWAGNFSYSEPLHAYYDNISFTAGSGIRPYRIYFPY